VPNHCYNRIIVPKNYIERVKEAIKGPNGPVDFNSLIPMPEELREAATAPHEKSKWTKEHRRRFKKYGATDWYMFSNKFWGTKWNAYAFGEFPGNVEGGIESFTTAWGPPEPFFYALSRKFPTITIKVDYDIELSNGAGTFYYRGGKCTGNVERNQETNEMRLL